jgi:hypothetical protein
LQQQNVNARQTINSGLLPQPQSRHEKVFSCRHLIFLSRIPPKTQPKLIFTLQNALMASNKKPVLQHLDQDANEKGT